MPKDNLENAFAAFAPIAGHDGNGMTPGAMAVTPDEVNRIRADRRKRLAQRLAKGSGLSLIALSVAACAGSDDDDATVYSLADFIAAVEAGTLAEVFELTIEPGSLGAFTVDAYSAIAAAVGLAVNAAEAEAAITDGTVTFDLSDSAEAILAFAETNPEDVALAVTITVTGDSVALTLVQFEDLADLGATFAGAVTVSGDAEAILATEADLSDVAVSVTGDPTLSVAQYEELVALGAVFAGAVTVADSEDALLAASVPLEGLAIVVTGNFTGTVDQYEFFVALDATFEGNIAVVDSADDILASDVDLSGVVLRVTGNPTLDVAEFEALLALRATFAGSVTVADSADNIIGARADLADVTVIVTGDAVSISVADLVELNALGATFAATPDVTVEMSGSGTQTVDIAGIDNLTLEVASPTTGADTFALTIDASGTGTVTFAFADSDDVVAVTGAIDGFTTVAVRFGTVDLTGATLDDSVEVVTVSSGVIMTAAQFLALPGGVEGGSADSSVQIEISTAAEAEAVIAAIANLGGTLDASMVEFVAADGSALTQNALTALNTALDDAMVQYAVDNALPAALDALEAAEAAVAAHEEVVAQLLEAAFENSFVEGAATDQDNDNDVEADDVITADIGEANDAAASEFVGTGKPIDLANGAAFNQLTDAQQDSLIALATTNLQTAIDTAETALATATDALEYQVAELIEAAEAALEAKNAADDAFNAAVLDTAAADAAVDAVISGGLGTITVGAQDYEYVDLNNNVTISVIAQDPNTNTWGVVSAISATLADGVYTITTGVTVRAEELDALVAALNAEVAALEAQTAANTALDSAVNAALVAQDATNPSWSYTTGISNDEIAYGDTDITAYVTAVDALEEAETALADFLEDVAAWEETDALADQLAVLTATGTALADAVTAAEAAIEETIEDGGLEIELFEAVGGVVDFIRGNLFTADGLYRYDPADSDPTGQLGDTITVQGFGGGGVDRMYFGDDSFTLVEMTEDESTADSLGSATALEIFAQEVENGLNAQQTDVVLYVENIATAGNGTTTSDMTVIVLEDVTLADLSFDSITNILTASSEVV